MAGKSPWGSGGNNGGGDGGDDDPSGGGDNGDDKGGGPRNPWLPGGGSGKRRSANIEDIFKNRGPEGPRRGGGGPRGPNFRLPQRSGGKSWLPLILGGAAVLWVGLSSVHFVQPRQQGVVTWLGGKYAATLNPGTNWTAPWPVQQVTVENVSQIRSAKIPEGNQEKLILTGDQNLVDLSYLVRWNIKNLTDYQFQLEEPQETILEAAEAAMRASVAEQPLDRVLSGEGRADIELAVMTRMQVLLDGYRAGIAVQGIEIDKTDPPQQVIEAFNDVLAAQQDAERDINGEIQSTYYFAYERLAVVPCRANRYRDLGEMLLKGSDEWPGTSSPYGAGLQTKYRVFPLVLRSPLRPWDYSVWDTELSKGTLRIMNAEKRQLLSDFYLTVKDAERQQYNLHLAEARLQALAAPLQLTGPDRLRYYDRLMEADAISAALELTVEQLIEMIETNHLVTFSDDDVPLVREFLEERNLRRGEIYGDCSSKVSLPLLERSLDSDE